MNITNDIAEILRVNCRRVFGKGRSIPKRVTLQITNKCNSRCTTCDIWKIYQETPDLLKDELSIDEWIYFAEKAIACGVKLIDITGGEPFLKEGVVDLMTVIAAAGRMGTVVTNALQPDRIAENVEKVLAGAGAGGSFCVGVSLDGFAETHDIRRGIPGSYDKAVCLLRRLGELKAGYPKLDYVISYTMGDDNFAETKPLMEYLLKERLIKTPDKFNFRHVQSGQRYNRDNNIDSTAQLLAAIEDIAQSYGLTRNKVYIDGMKATLRHPTKVYIPCYALFVSCWVDAYGDVTPCILMTDELMGNLRQCDYDIMVPWQSQRAKDVRRRIAKKQCPVCWTDCQAHESIYYSSIRRPLSSARMALQKLLSRQ